jgi:hypothetical protein
LYTLNSSQNKDHALPAIAKIPVGIERVRVQLIIANATTATGITTTQIKHTFLMKTAELSISLLLNCLGVLSLPSRARRQDEQNLLKAGFGKLQ